jgi:2,4-dienoyl-CoA reductase-like NADH-dependent reductase (Old Yellow Enzyme family)/thioredoxin reductase
MGASAYPTLLSPLERGRLQLRNRVVFPGHQTLFSEDGKVGDQLRAYYVERARGGVGAVIVEGGAVHPTTLKFPDYLRFYDPDVVPSLERLAGELHAHDTRAIVQLAHSGSRMATMDSREPLWAPSDVRSGNAVEIPHPMTQDDIAELLAGYRRSAELVASSGVDGIEIHAAHEYLLGEFLSPHNNLREDRYGGPLENRALLLLEVLAAVREVVGDGLVVGVRMNGSDRRSDGNTPEDYARVAAMLDATGQLDYLSLSAGTSIDNSDIVPPMDVPQAVNVDDAARIREAVEDLAIFTVGRIKRPEVAERVLAEGKADAVAMARALIADPEFVAKAGSDPARIRPCIGVNEGCYGRMVKVRPISCVVNPAVGLERDLGVGTLSEVDAPRRVTVVGGGPAGLEAARVAADRGHDVTVIEAAGELGGQLRLASLPAARRELRELVGFQARELERLGVAVRLSTRADARLLADETPDAVVVATGSLPRPSRLAAEDGVEVIDVPTAIARSRDGLDGADVVVVDDIGHLPAYVAAELLCDAGARVQVVTAAPMAAHAIEETTQRRTTRRLAGKGVRFATAAVAAATAADGLRVRDTLTGEERHLPASLVVAAHPNRAHDELSAALGDGVDVYVIGDALAPRTALEAVRDGHAVGRGL